ncbi:acyl-[ACP]--phospholipid O-acyltransferase [Aestuariivirga sp.]|uniref:acyl-[ACP]--phospholipid O-acyltransferase n=1 Tax=Aestuariivirga sp. TaxID=2650926 RepID=UPI0039E220B2
MTEETQLALLKTRKFLPLFVTQAIGAFNDNALRNGIAVLIVYDMAQRQGWNATLFVQAGAALFVLPYLLFSAISGQLADLADKALVARRVKLAELAVMLFGAAALWLDNAWLDLLVLFLAGSLAAFFGPVKYGILPQYLRPDQLVAGNALIEMGTFASILLGTIFGGALVLAYPSRTLLSATIVVLAVIAYAAAWKMLPAPSSVEKGKIDWNVPRQTFKIIGYARERWDVFYAVLGASWFWFLGLAILNQLPVFTKDILHADQNVFNIFNATFTIGIGAGSMLTNTLLKGEVSAKFVPIAAILMTLFLIDFYFTAGSIDAMFAGQSELGVSAFFSTFHGCRAIVDLFGVAFAGGLYAVPLNAIMQERSSPPKRSRVIAANNILNALFMIAATIFSVLVLEVLHLSQRTMFLSLAVANGIAAILICRLLPQELAASIAQWIFKLLYRVEVKGEENFHAAGRKAVIIANHTSYLDGPILSAFLPERASFAINTHVAQAWWARLAFHFFNMIPIDPTNPMAIRVLVDELKKGRRVVIFPEGRLSVTGALMKVYEGPGAIAAMADAKVLPVRIEGAIYSPFSRMRGKLRLRWFPKITLTFLPPVRFDAPEGLKGAALRQHQADKLYDVMTDMVFQTSHFDQTLLQALIDARHTHGGDHPIMEDIQRKPADYNRLLMGSFILGRRIARLTPGEKNIGLLLPNAIASVVTFFGLHTTGRVPAMLNFSTGPVNMAAALTAAQASTIVTSRRFIEAGQMEKDLEILQRNRKVIYLEDLRDTVGLFDKLYGVRARLFPHAALKRAGASADPNSPAVILFTSGSEGVPKGVVLSHRNLNANRNQAGARIAFTAQDIVFNALPMFHAFGLLAGVLLPVFAGVRSFQYPSPLHYKVVPELCYDTNATVLFGTDTFLMGYARNAHPYDFFNMRLVVAGAERVKPETRDIWMEKFGLRILEGYGATECSPVLAFNTPMHNKTGTVGRLFDRIDYRLDPVPGIEEGGRLFVKGPNIMLGYLRADNPGVIEPPPDGWYDTGDIVKVDEHGYVTILGRAKRFAKVAGEMISLSAVEGKLHSAFPDDLHAVVAVPDAKKGEQLVLFSTREGLDRKQVSDALKQGGATELMIPKNIIVRPELPLLGSGKTDYVTLNRLAQEQVKP